MTSSTNSIEAAPRSPWPERLSLAAVSLFGCLLIFNVYGWHVSSSVVVLCIGWLSLVVTAKLMWTALWAVASDDDEDDAARAQIDESRRGDLVREKRSLLRSIKDVEFDRDMGKMSEAEAGQILRVYRARAIEIIKELDSYDAGAAVATDDLPAEQAIERELEARLGATSSADTSRAREIQARRIEELERRDTPMFQMAGGLFLAGLGTFVTLATYKAAAGGGMYVMWYGPIVGGIALFARGFYGWQTLKNRPAPKSGDDKETK